MNVIHGMSIDQLLAIEGFHEGQRLRRSLAQVTAPLEEPAAGVTREQHEKIRSDARAAYQAVIAEHSKGSTPWHEGFRAGVDTASPIAP